MRALHIASWTLAGVNGVLLMILGVAANQTDGHPWVRWLALGAALFAIVFFVTAVFTARIDCPQCKEYAGHAFRGALISSRPLHARVDGQPDRRYRHNPMIEVYEQKGRCTKCGYEWLRSA